MASGMGWFNTVLACAESIVHTKATGNDPSPLGSYQNSVPCSSMRHASGMSHRVLHDRHVIHDDDRDRERLRPASGEQDKRRGHGEVVRVLHRLLGTQRNGSWFLFFAVLELL